MKKLFAIATLIAGTLVMVSCGDDDGGGPTTFDQPGVSVGNSADIANGGTGTVTFNVTLDADLTTAAAWTLVSTGVEAATIGGATSGTIESSGPVTVDVTAGTTAGPATITLAVVNPAEDVALLSGNATATFSVLAPGDNSVTLSALAQNVDNNPPTDISVLINEGDGISLPGTVEAINGDFEGSFSVEALDGLASLSVTINGGTPVELLGVAGVTDGAGTALAVGVTSITGIVIPGSAIESAYTAGITNTFIFTAEDADGDDASSTITVDITEAVDTYAETTGVTDLQGNTAVQVVGEITNAVTWDAANVYIITGRLIVGNGGTLTIPAGTIIKGETGAGVNAKALIVAVGGTININGTAAQPVIMTSINDGINPGEITGTLAADVNGLWGGLIVLGDATISASAAQVQIEGIPTSVTQGLYGGTNDTDNSGSISYLSLRHGGSNIGAGNEINGITLGGVGSGTVINHVEVVANQDDGIEFFGGNVSIDNAVVWNCGDDSMDSDQDWQGTVDNFIIVTPAGGSAFELDGPEGAAARATPGFHTFTNGDIYVGSDIDHLVDWDGSTNAALTNIFWFGLPNGYPDANAATPIESFQGDAAGTSSAWEVVLNDQTKAAIFGDADGITTAVTSEATKTVGADQTVFGWTLFGNSTEFTTIYP